MCFSVRRPDQRPCAVHGIEVFAVQVVDEAKRLLQPGVQGMMMFFDWHSQDSRATGPLDVAGTVTALYGTGGQYADGSGCFVQSQHAERC